MDFNALDTSITATKNENALRTENKAEKNPVK